MRKSGFVTTKDGQTGSFVEEYLCYLSEKKNRSALTLDSYRNDLAQFIAFLAESTSADTDSGNIDTCLLSVNADCARRFVDGLKGHYTPSTLGRKITAIRGLYGYLVTTERLSVNPFARVRIRHAAGTKLEYLREAHLQQLFDAISGSHWLAFRDRAIVAILYSTGMRVGELLNLNTADIDSETAAIHIRTTGRATRLCRPAPWAWQTLERYLVRRPVRETADSAQTDVLFVNRDGHRLTARSVRRKLAEYSRRAGLPVEATPANLRHSCAIHMLRHGADVKTVRELLGHLSASSMRPYLNCLSDEQHQPATTSVPLETAAF